MTAIATAAGASKTTGQTTAGSGGPQAAGPTGLEALFAVLLNQASGLAAKADPASQLPQNDNGAAPSAADGQFPQGATSVNPNVPSAQTMQTQASPLPADLMALLQKPTQTTAEEAAPGAVANPATNPAPQTESADSSTHPNLGASPTVPGQQPSDPAANAVAEMLAALQQPTTPAAPAKTAAKPAASNATSGVKHAAPAQDSKPTDPNASVVAAFVAQQLQGAAMAAAGATVQKGTTPSQAAATSSQDPPAVGAINAGKGPAPNAVKTSALSSGASPPPGTAPTSPNGVNPLQTAAGAHRASGEKPAANSDNTNAPGAQSAAGRPGAMPPATSQPAALTVAAQHAAAQSAAAAGTPQIQTAAPMAAAIQVAPQHHASGTTATSSLDSLGLTIAAKSVDGTKHFDIRLDPPELGRVQVQLSVDNSGKAQATLVVDKPQTLQLLQSDAPNLNRALTDAGINLSNNGLNFSLRDQNRQNASGSADKGRSRSLSVKAVVGTTSPSGSIASFAPNSVRLDIRV